MTLTEFAVTKMPVRNKYTPSQDTSYSLFLNVDFSKDVIDLPVLLKWYFDSNNNNYNNDRIVVPLYEGAIINRKVASTMVNDFVRRPYYNRLTTVKSDTGVLYYGNSGIILDSDRHILFLSCIRMGRNKVFKTEESVYYISPRAFNNNGILHKTIVKNLIPAIINNSFRGSYTININDNIDEEFLVKPSKPLIGIDEDKLVTDIIKNNINYIFNDT